MNEEQQGNQNVDDKKAKKKAKNKESANNNAELINQAAQAAGKTATPWGKAIGIANKIDNKVFGGKVKQKLGDKAGKAMKMAPGGKLAQGAINNASKFKNIKNGSSTPQALKNRQGKTINRNLGTSSQSSQKSGDSGQDNGETSEKQSGLSKKPGLGLKDALSEKVGGGLKNKFTSMFASKGSSGGDSTEGDANGTDIGKKLKGALPKLLIIASPVIFFFLLFAALLAIFIGWFDVHPANETTGSAEIGGSGGGTTEIAESHFLEQQCGSDEEDTSAYTVPMQCTDAQKNFYDTLDNVYNDYAKNKEVALNADMIMAAIFYGRNTDGGTGNNSVESNQFEDAAKSDEENEEENDKEKYRETDIGKLADHMVSGNELDYDKFQEYLTDDYVPNHYQAYILTNKDEYEEYKDKTLPSDKYGERIEQVVQAIMGSYYVKEDSSSSSSGSTGGVCTFAFNGKSATGIKVRLMETGRFGGREGHEMEGEELVDFKKYVYGVVYAEQNAVLKDEASFKAWVIVATSVSITMSTKPVNSLEEVNGQWILSLKNSTDDHVYCDPYKGCSRDIPRCSNCTAAQAEASMVYSGIPKGKYIYKDSIDKEPGLGKEVREQSEKWLDEVFGEYAVDANGNITATGYANDNDINTKKDIADYQERVIAHYSNVTGIKKANCTGPSTGDYAEWKQGDPAWGSVTIGSSNIANIGCLATSVSMLIKKSGIDTSKVAKEFNPGTFVQAINKINGFAGDNYVWGVPEKLGLDFEYVGTTNLKVNAPVSERLKIIKEKLDEGLYCTIEVKQPYAQHWVAIDNIDAKDNKKVNIMDPAGNARTYLKGGVPADKNGNIPWVDNSAEPQYYGSQLACYKVKK